MSASNLKALLEKAAQDTALQARLTQISALSPEAALAEITQISQDYGLPITAQELAAAVSPAPADLTDAELSTISGGLMPPPLSGGPNLQQQIADRLKVIINEEVNAAYQKQLPALQAQMDAVLKAAGR